MNEEELERLYMDIYDNGILDYSYKEKFKRYINNRIGKLEKENAELKYKLNKIEKKCKFNFVDLLHDVENESKQEEQLTKAKEIIKYLLSFIQKENYKTRWDINIAEAEQFLKDSEGK